MSRETVATTIESCIVILSSLVVPGNIYFSDTQAKSVDLAVTLRDVGNPFNTDEVDDMNMIITMLEANENKPTVTTEIDTIRAELATL